MVLKQNYNNAILVHQEVGWEARYWTMLVNELIFVQRLRYSFASPSYVES